MNRREFLTGAALAAATPGAAALAAATGGPRSCAAGNGQDARCPSFSVVVVGGGPAGACAAVAAARNGADVLVVEQGNCLGGMATRGLVGPFMTCSDTTGEQLIVQGLFMEIVERMVAAGGAIHPRDVRAGTPFTAWITHGHDHVTPFDPEALKFTLDDLCREAGVRILYHATFLAPVMEGGRITGVEVFTKAGPQRIKAKVVIDATGDGDVAFRAGVPCELGDAGRGGAMQPCTTFFRIAGLPEEVLVADYRSHGGGIGKEKDGRGRRLLSWYVEKARAAGKWHIPRPHVNLYRGVRSDEWFVNCSRLSNVDATDPKSLSAAETEGRRQVREILDLLRTYLPGGENIRLVSTASTLGVRETRHVAGEYRLDKDDVVNGAVPSDSVFVCSSSIDLHGGKGKSGTLYVRVRKGRWYGVPYRCLVPQKVDGLLVAGRCVSASSVAAAAIRVMPPAMAMGQAAGTAAALACADGVAPRALDAARLVATLRAQKVFLG